jgi:diguanylate cyclase (GGDEF)-like protein
MQEILQAQQRNCCKLNDVSEEWRSYPMSEIPQDEPRKELQEQVRLRREVEKLEERDFQLWSIVILILLLLAVGLVALLLPNVMWHLPNLKFDGHLLPQLVFGLITLIVLFNIYVIKMRLDVRNAREELVLQMVYNEASERLSLVDPLTDTFNRRYMDQVLGKDLSRAERQGISLGFLMIDVNDFKSVNTGFGHLTGDRVLVEVAHVLKKTFRAADTIIRFGGDEFLVVLSDTDNATAQPALGRLQTQIEKWNNSGSIPDYRMSLSWGLEFYVKGSDLRTVLNAADQKMYQHKRAFNAGE